ncbi:hypothetical protein PG913_02615 [Tenacibaculum pacificus]|uniref:hypothetical protein n=1 Tax=Tenacibaculum pacificus TaxID=3018314 RepID=UPI0022F3C956|nr:hypothetical protein [Tenacibaculum pacificus]WBX74140.1 hypothetical protein PG913_02615 [Tenacibaculum pacificus]
MFSKYDESSYQEQCRRLNKVLKYSAKKIPFYNGINHNSLQNYPVVTKDVIRQQQENFISPDYDISKLTQYHTSGSTGTPFFVYYSPYKVLCNHVSLIYHYRELGYNIGDKMFYFRAWNDLNNMSFFTRLKKNMVMQNCSATKSNMDFFFKNLDTSNNYLLGYVSSFVAYSQKLKDKKVEGVNAIITGSEHLSDSDRNYISKAFSAPVYSRYSNEENGIISQQIIEDSSKFRINWPDIWLEILKIDSDEPVLPGEQGRVVITDLCNLAMPIIRYDTGDLSSYDKIDKYKNSLLWMNNIDGRLVDSLYDTSGEILNSFHIVNLFWNTQDYLDTFQFIQEEQKKYLLKYVSDIEIDEILFSEIIKNLIGKDADLQFEKVDKIPLLRSGKRRYVMNNYKKI